MTNLFNGNLSELVDKINDLSAMSDLINFAGEKTLGSIVKKLQNGCPDLTSQYNALPCEPAKIEVPTYQLETEGLFFDVATFLNGTPECWLNESYNNNSKPAKDFYINVTVAAVIPQKTIFEKLIQIVQIIDSLEGNGQRLNIFICCYAEGYAKNKRADHKGNKLSMLCKIKDSSEPVNLEQLIYLCASPVMLRYCFLRLQRNVFENAFRSVTDMNAEEILRDSTEIIYIPSIRTDRERLGITNYTETDLRTAYKII